MSISILGYIRERGPLADDAPSGSERMGAQRRSHWNKDGFFLAPGLSPKTYLDDPEFSDAGRDARFIKGRWLGIAILAAAALCAVCLGFVSVWAALALTIVS
jgi:hypothetical protein